MHHTREEAIQWTKENSEELDQDRLACESEDIQMFNRIAPAKSKELWDIGCWIEHELLKCGATADKVKEVQFAMGQRAFFQDAAAVAVLYVNEFAEHAAIKDKPGVEFARQLNEEFLPR